MDWYAAASMYVGRTDPDGPDAIRPDKWTAVRHDTEADGFTQGSQPYYTGSHPNWYDDPPRSDDRRFTTNESTNRHPNWFDDRPRYDDPKWYDDPPRPDGRPTTSDPTNHRPTGTWHDLTPMNEEVRNASAYGNQPSLHQYNQGKDEIRVLFQRFGSEITDIELLWLSMDGYTDPTRLIRLCTKPAREIYNSMCASVTSQYGYQYYEKIYFEQRFLEIFTTFQQVVMCLVVDLDCRLWSERSIEDCLDCIYDPWESTEMINASYRRVNECLANFMDDLPHLQAYILWRNAQGIYNNSLYATWDMLFADNALASDEISKPENTATDSEGDTTILASPPDMDPPTTVWPAGTERQTSLRSRLLMVRRESPPDPPTDSTGYIPDPDSMATTADAEHVTSDIENIPPTSTDLNWCQVPGVTECSSNHPHSHGAEYISPPYEAGDDNPIDRGGQSQHSLQSPTTLCPRTAIGKATNCTATSSQAVHNQATQMLPQAGWDDDPSPPKSTIQHQWGMYHPAARMLPHFPWDDDPGQPQGTPKHQRDTHHHAAQVLSYFPSDDDPSPSESTTQHQWDMYHPAARVLPHFPWDDDPGQPHGTPKHQRDAYHHAAQVLSYFPSDDDPSPTHIGTIQ
jgi:hypothetical protein